MGIPLSRQARHPRPEGNPPPEPAPPTQNTTCRLFRVVCGVFMQGYGPKSQVEQQIKETLREKVSEAITDFLKANTDWLIAHKKSYVNPCGALT